MEFYIIRKVEYIIVFLEENRYIVVNRWYMDRDIEIIWVKEYLNELVCISLIMLMKFFIEKEYG